ncbi:MAG TPA: CPBP family intramembrane glutamic endopeptidase [Thermoanaerobaculia bacterium]|nr:CPBP family intramembrane glutamic endopeptidase [Thermoanaerobaculia bacterium]
MAHLAGPIAAALGLAAAFALDRLCAVRGLLPPGFRQLWRRVLAGSIVAGFLAAGVFLPLAAALAGLKIEPPNLSKIETFQLFELHLIMVAVMGSWFLLGFAGLPKPREAPAEPVPPIEPVPIPLEGMEIPAASTEGAEEMAAQPLPEPPAPPPPPPPRVSLGRQFLIQFGFVAPDVPKEVGLGLTLGLGAWLAVLAAVLAVAGILIAVGGQDAVPHQPPALIPLIAALPFAVRLAISLSAGIVEESFFRGFLQPRVGIGLSTACFALAHLSYGQPFLLVGVTLLSLIYAFLVRWRQSLWAAMTAHALFDGIQLLVVVPAVLKLTQGVSGKAAAFLSCL